MFIVWGGKKIIACSCRRWRGVREMKVESREEREADLMGECGISDGGGGLWWVEWCAFHESFGFGHFVVDFSAGGGVGGAGG